MKKIAVINDLSGMGKCSLAAALPVISVMGVQACPLPTAVLSGQTGYHSYFYDDYTEHMEAIMKEWKKQGLCLDGIYTGFLSGSRQAEKVLAFLDMFQREDTKVLVDPVMGDQGVVYGIYTPQLRRKMQELARRADVITPNLTEALLLLYGKEKMEQIWKDLKSAGTKEYLQEIERVGIGLAEQFHLQAAAVTGIDYLDEGNVMQIGNLVREKGVSSWSFARKQGGSYSGTGDLFASVLSAGIVKGISVKECADIAVDFLENAIRDAVEEGTDRNDGVCFEKYLVKLLGRGI